MNKKNFSLLIILIVVLTLCQCTRGNDVKDLGKSDILINERENLPFYYLNSVSLYNENIYYIGTLDGKMYQYNDGGKVSEFNMNEIDSKIEIFAFTDTYFVGIRNTNELTLINLLNNDKKELIWEVRNIRRSKEAIGYTNYPDCIIYDNYAIYITTNNEIAKLNFNDLTTDILVKDHDVFLMQPYKDSVIFTVKTNNAHNPNSMYLLELREEKISHIADGYYYNIRIVNDYVYYLNDYSIYRLSLIEGKNEIILRDSNIFDFEVADKKIICQASEGLIMCSLDGNNIKVVSEEKCNILQARGDYAFYYELESLKPYIIDLNTNETKDLKIEGEPLNCYIFSNFVHTKW